jgi:hypothetical protein
MEIFLTYVYLLLAAFFIVAPIALGAYALFFSRRFSFNMYRQRKALWKIDFTERDVRVGQVFAMAFGAVALIIGTIVAVQLLF